MTREEVLAATTEAAEAAAQLADHLERLTGRLQAVFPLTAEQLGLWGDEQRETLHALLRMFDQLHDLTSRKLVRGLLFLSGETIAGLSAQNQFRRVEAIGGPFADDWIALGTVRNLLAHDYPTNPGAQAARANRAWSDAPRLIAAVRRILEVLRTEGHLP